MARKCFISFKTEDLLYKQYIQNHSGLDMIDKSLNEAIDSENEEYIMRKIREDYLSDSTVTIHLIGLYGAESRGAYEQRYIKRELQASLYHGIGNTQNGLLGVVLPDAYASIYGNSYYCSSCGGSHQYVALNDSTTIKEFSCNYYIPEYNKCSWGEEDRFCVLVKWEDFLLNPELYVEQAFQKRSSLLANKTQVRP
ncbi:hypothetical protein GCM10027422_23060 [Hymenobacter arcticus]